MTKQQQTAIAQHCRLAYETAMPQFFTTLAHPRVGIVLSVNSGYE